MLSASFDRIQSTTVSPIQHYPASEKVGEFWCRRINLTFEDGGFYSLPLFSNTEGGLAMPGDEFELLKTTAGPEGYNPGD